MIWDPVYGGIDWDGVKQLTFYLVCGAFIVSFGASTSGSWYDPYVWSWGLIISNSTWFIAGSMVLLLAGYFYERFSGGW